MFQKLHKKCYTVSLDFFKVTFLRMLENMFEIFSEIWNFQKYGLVSVSIMRYFQDYTALHSLDTCLNQKIEVAIHMPD